MTTEEKNQVQTKKENVADILLPQDNAHVPTALVTVAEENNCDWITFSSHLVISRLVTVS